MSTENKDVENVETVEKNGDGFEQLKADLKQDLVGEITSEVKKEFARNSKSFAVAKEDKTPSFGEYLQNVAILNSNKSNPDEKTKSFNWMKDKFSEKAMTQGSAAGGGNTVPVIYSDKIFDVEGFESAFFPNGGTVFPMASNVEKYPSWDFSVTPTGAGDTAFGAGHKVTTESENTQPTAVNPVTKQITFTADKLMSLSEVSNELVLNNSVALEQMLLEKIRRECISQIDYNVANGNGSNQSGYIGHAATKAVARNTSSDVKLIDLANMYAKKLPRVGLNDYRWIINPTVLPKLMTLASTSGQIVWAPNGIAGAIQMFIFGIPVVITDIVPPLGSEGDVSLVYTKGMGIGVNKNITIDASSDYKFGYDLICYRLTAQIAVKPFFTNKIKMVDGTNELAAFVTLDDATS